MSSVEKEKQSYKNSSQRNFFRDLGVKLHKKINAIQEHNSLYRKSFKCV